MFILVDSHAHLDTEYFKEDQDEVIKRAKAGGVDNIITVGVDLKSSLEAVNMTYKYEGIYAAVGFHPHNAKIVNDGDMENLINKALDSKVVAWGEIGLDFFKNYSPPDVQMKLFRQQLRIALELDLPVIIHDRDAHEQVLSVIKEYKVRGVIHCFSGDLDLAKKFIEMGFYISIPATVTYKKASKIRKVVSHIPLDYILVETDSPFLPPHQKRGERNEPLFVKYVAQEISLIKGVDFELVAEVTTNNAKRLFNI